MNAATYHVTTPAQLERHREEQRLAEERVARSVERTAQLTRAMCAAPTVRRALSTLALAALAACGGGGGGGGGFAVVAPTAAAPEAAKQPAAPAAEPLKLSPVNPGCVSALDTHVECPLIASGELIGVGVPAGTYVRFTNRTGSYLQIDSVQAATGETQLWSEICVYVGDLVTGQHQPGIGEAGCATKNAGENYPTIRWGEGTGLSVAPGEVVYLNSHTEPALENHTYALSVRVQTTGLHSWRQPQQDAVIYCDGQQQSTAPTPWRNETGRELHLSGASVYSEDGRGSNTLSGPACIYVMDASGATKYQNCDSALRSRGEVSFPVVTIAPGEYVSAQAVNTCAALGVWDWAAFLRVW